MACSHYDIAVVLACLTAQYVCGHNNNIVCANALRYCLMHTNDCTLHSWLPAWFHSMHDRTQCSALARHTWLCMHTCPCCHCVWLVRDLVQLCRLSNVQEAVHYIKYQLRQLLEAYPVHAKPIDIILLYMGQDLTLWLNWWHTYQFSNYCQPGSFCGT